LFDDAFQEELATSVCPDKRNTCRLVPEHTYTYHKNIYYHGAYSYITPIPIGIFLTRNSGSRRICWDVIDGNTIPSFMCIIILLVYILLDFPLYPFGLKAKFRHPGTSP